MKLYKNVACAYLRAAPWRPTENWDIIGRIINLRRYVEVSGHLHGPTALHPTKCLQFQLYT
jgi:hypothetical protein